MTFHDLRIEPGGTASGSEQGKAMETAGGFHVHAGILPLARSTPPMVAEVTGFVDPWDLPGHGQPYPDCGQWIYRGCLNVEGHRQQGLEQDHVGKVYVELTTRSCGRLECPTCYEKAAGLEAHKIAYRLGVVKRSMGQVIHVIVSPSKYDVQTLSYRKLREKTYKIAKRSGFRGGSCIFHPYRKHPYKGWYFSPHFHLIGHGWIVWGQDLYEKTGWVVKNRGLRKSVEGTAFYQLTHCGVDKHKAVSFDGRMVRQTHSVTWFGKMAYNKIKIVPEEEPEHICPICHKKLEILTYRGRAVLPVVEGPYYLDPDGWELRGAWWFEGG